MEGKKAGAHIFCVSRGITVRTAVWQTLNKSIRDDAKGIALAISVVLLTVALLELLPSFGVVVPNPQLFVALAIIFAAYKGGYIGGLAGAAFGITYGVYFFALPDEWLAYTPDNGRRVIVNIIVMPVMAVLVASLRHRLAESVREQARAFIDNANAPIIGVDPSGLFRAWNAEAANITGCTLAEVRGRPLNVIWSAMRRDVRRSTRRWSGPLAFGAAKTSKLRSASKMVGSVAC